MYKVFYLCGLQSACILFTDSHFVYNHCLSQ